MLGEVPIPTPSGGALGPSGCSLRAHKVVFTVLLDVESFCQVWESWPFPRGLTPLWQLGLGEEKPLV